MYVMAYPRTSSIHIVKTTLSVSHDEGACHVNHTGSLKPIQRYRFPWQGILEIHDMLWCFYPIKRYKYIYYSSEIHGMVKNSEFIACIVTLTLFYGFTLF